MESLNIGIQLTVFGMGLVFLLLAVMAICITLLLRFDRAQPEPQQEPAPTLPSWLNADALAAVSIAVAMHRQVLRKEAAPTMRQHQPGSLPSRWVSVGRTLQNSTWDRSRRTQ